MKKQQCHSLFANVLKVQNIKSFPWIFLSEPHCVHTYTVTHRITHAHIYLIYVKRNSFIEIFATYICVTKLIFIVSVCGTYDQKLILSSFYIY